MEKPDSFFPLEIIYSNSRGWTAAGGLLRWEQGEEENNNNMKKITTRRTRTARIISRATTIATAATREDGRTRQLSRWGVS